MNKKPGKQLNVIDDLTLAQILERPKGYVPAPEPPAGEWVRILRHYLRMTQAELAKRAKITQPHIVGIEKGRFDPQVGTLRRIFQAMGCEVAIHPEPQKPLEEILRGRAGKVALKRLKQSMGTMALEKQAPEAELFRRLLKKRTDDILADKREKLWNKEDE